MAVRVDSKPAANEPEVIIKTQAYIKMLKHVLLYGNANKQDSVEVMGICYGKVEGNKMIQYDAVPISHGGAIEVEFSTLDYAAFATADEQFADKGWYAIGWYHSHPGLKAFFSKTDIKNHLFYQKEQTPFAYGIVFDHTYFDTGEDALKWGFKAFRLNDYKKGLSSDFHDIQYTVELPDDLSYYHEIDSIIENIQKKRSIIAEANEAIEGDGTWEEPTEEAGTEEGPKKEIDTFQDIKHGYIEGSKIMTQGFMGPLFNDLQQFTTDTQSAALKGPTVIISAVEEMRDTIENGLGRVQSFFETALEKEIKDVSKSIDDQLKKFVLGQMEIPKKLTDYIQKMGDTLTASTGEQLEKSMEGIMGNFKKLVFMADKIAEKQQDFAKVLTDQEGSIKQFSESVKTSGTNLNNNVGNIVKTASSLIGKKTDSIKGAASEIKRTNAELKAQLDELTKMLMAKRK